MRLWQRIQQPWRKWDDTRLRRNLGVYVHVPLCLKRCRYCDFLSFGPAQRPAGLTAESYAQLLHTEIAACAELAHRFYAPEDRRVDSVFFGGGTPTCLPAELLCGLVSDVLAHFPLAEDGAEATVEANPDTLTADYIRALHDAGVNRLSIGVQATQPRHLAFLGRTHRWRGIEPVLAAVASGPIRRLSFDLIYAVPRLTCAELRQSVRRLMALGAEHLSAYELTIEPTTPIGAWSRRFPRQLPSETTVLRQQRSVEDALAGYSLYRYEVSNYARPGAECRHNLRYWRGGDYIGLGLGAASRIGSEVINNSCDYRVYEQEVRHTGGSSNLQTALNMRGRQDASGMAPTADRFLQLRTRAGITSELMGAAVSDWLLRGWVRVRGGRVEVTSAGLNYADLLGRYVDAG